MEILDGDLQFHLAKLGKKNHREMKTSLQMLLELTLFDIIFPMCVYILLGVLTIVVKCYESNQNDS